MNLKKYLEYTFSYHSPAEMLEIILIDSIYFEYIIYIAHYVELLDPPPHTHTHKKHEVFGAKYLDSASSWRMEVIYSSWCIGHQCKHPLKILHGDTAIGIYKKYTICIKFCLSLKTFCLSAHTHACVHACVHACAHTCVHDCVFVCM